MNMLSFGSSFTCWCGRKEKILPSFGNDLPGFGNELSSKDTIGDGLSWSFPFSFPARTSKFTELALETNTPMRHQAACFFFVLPRAYEVRVHAFDRVCCTSDALVGLFQS